MKTKFYKKLHLLKEFGPGIITGAADDDPSGIGTYTVAGAQFGYAFLWTAWLTWPLACFVQIMCAKIVIASRQSLTAAMVKKFPRPIILFLIAGLFVANTLNVAADLAGMADALEILTHVSTKVYEIGLGIAIALMMIFLNYVQMTRLLVWLTFFLLAYVFTAFASDVDWPGILRHSLLPSLPTSSAGWATLVAILGTTISPYLFFWQAAQEYEEIHQKSSRNVKESIRRVLKIRRIDVALGTFVSNIVMFFIIVTAGANLFKFGFTNIQNSTDAARALEPLLGKSATYAYTIGIVGVGLLAIPTLLGSAAFALADYFKIRSGLDRRLSDAKIFYGIVTISTLLAVLLDFLNVNPIKALFWSAIINGLLSPFLMVAVLIIASDKLLMRGMPSTLFSRGVVAFATLLMVAAGVGMFVF